MADDYGTHDIEHLGSLFALDIPTVGKTYFTECSGLEVEVEVVEHTDAMSGDLRTRKRPGRIKYGDITLKRGLTASKDVTDWMQKVLDGKVERADGSIIVYDSALDEVDRWNFEQGWPSKWSASDLNAGSDDVMIEEITITHEYIERA